MNLSKGLCAEVADLWSDDPAVRLSAVKSLYRQVSDMVDIRCAQPALTLCLRDPDPEVRQAALSTVEYRAELGADIGMAVPMLASLLDDPSEEIRESAWRTLCFADGRLNGILNIVEQGHPDFVFGRSTRTTALPAAGAPLGPEVNPLTDAWGTEPYDTVQARELFGKLISGAELDRHVTDALCREDDFNAIRAAAYLLETFGIAHVWPGDVRNLRIYLERAVGLLQKMIDRSGSDLDREFLERWNHSREISVSVERQIDCLTRRIEKL